MAMKSLILLALALPSLAAAQETPPAPTCQAIDTSIPAELAAWRTPSALTGSLRPGAAVQVPLQPIGEIRMAPDMPIAPHEARDGGATTGARLDLEIATAGTYRVALDRAIWIDLVRDGQAVRSAANGHGPACSSIHKTIDFTLAPGRYVIQLSGTTAAVARLLVIPR
jgi:hypothetical protein